MTVAIGMPAARRAGTKPPRTPAIRPAMIPATPASHGCVRVPMWESGWVHDAVAVGDPVYVVGGKVAPVPFGETAPVDVPDEVTVSTSALNPA